MFGFNIIGRGAFTNCYDLGNNNVLLESVDFVKECFAHGWIPEHALLPKIEFAPSKYDSNKSRGEYDYNYYIAPKYNRVRGYKKDLKKEDQLLYKQLKALSENLIGEVPKNKNNCIYILRNNINNSDLSNDIKDLLNECIDSLSNYGSDIWFEISPRNIATDEKGDLILLDCFYFIGQLEKIRGF